MKTRFAQIGQHLTAVAAVAISAAAMLASTAHAAWEPTKPVEFVVPAGTGGGADQMARFIQGVVIKHKLMSQPMIVVNKAGARVQKVSWTSKAPRVTRTRSSSRCQTCSPHPWPPACLSAGKT